MENPYLAPGASLDNFEGKNTSGTGPGAEIPPGVAGWSWGAFLLNWIWAIGNRTWVGLLALVPYIGFIAAIYLGVKGRELAWRNKQWDSVEHFNRVQRKWTMWALILMLGGAVIGIVAAILIPIFAGR
ncbi:hypothetical protein GCM10027277_04610 [Pseudoduganella ginsengisoli]|uniref:Uncharacterized protein n=1 Tax=Pseudoduganella ginsengisoli TaxID=1462440 RepID=A0A6L6Q5W1_9BURK|nr:hypothetical protein [Pseudoduganella ginsengisoli]MTW04896.1 hypothetical protein [Pseudoduganella ginsengisoli]